MSIYLRDFKENSIKIKNNVKISKFIPKNMKNLIKEKIPAGNYILGVTYKTGDSQIGISGHPKGLETMEEGASRELQEELSLRCKYRIRFCYTDHINHFCFININDTLISCMARKNDLKDIRDRAVICVYGSEKDILHYLANVTYDLNNEDQIESIWCTSKENIIYYLETKPQFLDSKLKFL